MLIEREVEHAALRDVLTAAIDGAGSTTLIVGPPGIGKTALLQATAAATPEMLRLWARGGELEQEFPYGVVRQLFEGVLRAAGDPERAALLDGPARPAAALLGSDFAGISGDASALEHAVYWLIVTLSERSPIALYVDDAQWADVASLRTLVHLARRIRELPVALVMTARPGDGPRRALIERLAAEAGRTLRPSPLTPDGVGRLVHETLGAADDDFCGACHSASGGNPFLVSELIGAVQASGLDPVGANAHRLRQVGAQNVMRSVVLRLAGLSPAATSVARAISVLGECHQLHVIAELAEVPERTAATALDELREAHIAALDQPARFVHGIVHTAVYEDVAPALRSQLHASAAHLLAGVGASTDAVAAHLLLTTPGSDPWVFDQLLGAASSGLAMTTPEATAAYLDRALRESVVTGADRARLLLGLGGSRFQTVDGGAVEPLTEALSLATDRHLRMEIVRALASAYMTENRYDECWSLVDRAVAELSGHSESVDVELFAAQAIFTDVAAAPGMFDRIKRWRPDPTGASGHDRSMLAVQAWADMAGPAPAAQTAVKARAALSTGTLVEDDVWYVSFELAVWSLIAAGCYDEALDHLNATIASLQAAGKRLRAATILPIRAEVRRRLGHLQRAEEDARTAVDVIPPEQIYAPQSVSALMFVLLDRGDVDGARAVLTDQGFADAIPRGGVNDILWLARGRLRICSGDVASGVDDVLAYGAISDKLRRRNPAFYPWRSTAASALVQLGHRSEALTLASEEVELAEAVGLPGAVGRALTAVGVAQLREESVTTLARAVDLLDGSPLTLDAVAARLALGRALRLAGKREVARESLRLALDAATRADARPLADSAQAELAAAGARPRRTALDGVAALTPSEHRVASLAAQGLTNRQIAHTLYVTPKTIEAHLAAVYRKLKINGKGDLGGILAAELAQVQA